MCPRDPRSKTNSPPDFLFYPACYPISGETKNLLTFNMTYSSWKFTRFGQGLAPKPAPLSTSYTTSTVTKVSTITSDVTEEITITFLNRPITTNYVRTTTMVRSIASSNICPCINSLSSGCHWHPRVSVASHIRVMESGAQAEKVQRILWPWKIKLSCKSYTEFLNKVE